ncbi:MAG: sulfatase-like hydrolase/transferase [Bacteroidales bacterium]|nr:sulfatase-like hydrolase/transferase [Bacteroidales bacterium]MCF8389175.1 sulfatase-like hydrolase/transferase [Bacteroidales bacterium]
MLCTIIIGCSRENKNTPDKPNIVIFLMDDMGYGDISCYRKDATPTPNIDKLSEQGVLCTDFYVPTPYCAPSRTTLLTGRFPLRHGIVRNPAPDAGINDVGIKDSEVLLGEVLQETGYRTSCIGKWHMGHTPEFFPAKHGFDEYFGILYSNDMRPVQLIENMDTLMYPVDQSILTKTYTEKAIKFIRENKSSPFFLHLCHAMPHKPLAASKAFYTPETPDDLYADVISELDWSVSEVMKVLGEEGLLKNTIVIFMSDNGASYGGNVTPLKGKKATNWEGGVRVPFLIIYPEVLPSGTKINIPCWSPDIFPTLLSLADIAIPQEIILDGENITEILRGNQEEHKAIFTMSGTKINTIRKGDWKLFLEKPSFFMQIDLENWVDKRAPDGISIIAPSEQATPAQYPGVRPEYIPGVRYLFNISEDISEMKNQYEENSEIAIELESIYYEFLESLDQK